MLDISVVGFVVMVVVVIAFLKGYAYEKGRDSNDGRKYSDEDIQRFEDIIRDLKNSKK